jgi:thiol-disulfide isomerase/thioredoxin
MLNVLMMTGPWCTTCKAVKQGLGDFPYREIDVEVDREAANYDCIVSLPTFLVVDDEGRELVRHAGPITRQALQKLVSSCQTAT